MANQLASGATVPARRINAIDGRPVEVPAAVGGTRVEFRRFAGGSIRRLHLHSVADRRAGDQWSAEESLAINASPGAPEQR